MVMGDLVLLEAEINPVMLKLIEGGLEITAVKPEHFKIRVFHGWNAQLNLAPERSKLFRLKPNRREL
jgi:hypothetical protein